MQSNPQFELFVWQVRNLERFQTFQQVNRQQSYLTGMPLAYHTRTRNVCALSRFYHSKMI